MDYAYRSDGELVSAAKAGPSRYSRYTCPLCGASVVLRRGEIKRAHFAHRKGHGSDACEDYHPPNVLGDQSKPEQKKADKYQTSYFAPRLILRADSNDNSSSSFDLILELPAPSSSGGKMSLILGPNRQREVKVTTGLGNRRYPLDIYPISYGVNWCSPDVEPAYRKCVEGTISGPRFDQGTLFKSSGELAQEVGSSDSYWVLIDSESELQVEVPFRSIKKRDRWELFQISLADLDDDEVTALSELCDVPIAPSVIRITALTLAFALADLPSRISAVRGEQIPVAITSTSSRGPDLQEYECIYPVGSEFEVRSVMTGTSYALLDTSVVDDLAVFRAGATHLTISASSDTAKPDAIDMKTYVQLGERYIPLSPQTEPEVLEILMQVNSVAELVAPHGVNATVYLQTLNRTEAYRLRQPESQFTLRSAYDLSAIRERLKSLDEPLQIKFDIGSFGQAIYEFTAEASEDEAQIDIHKAREIIRCFFSSHPHHSRNININSLTLSEINDILKLIELNPQAGLRAHISNLREI